MKELRRFLFVDFDGVFHPVFAGSQYGSPYEKFHFLKNFEEVVRKSPYEIKIVISSSHRISKNLEELQAIFSPDIAPMVIGATPNHGWSSAPGSRQREVEAWLKSNNLEDVLWIAIDDYEDIYKAGAPLVDCQDKFDQREASLLNEALADPVKYAAKRLAIAEGIDSDVIPKKEKPRFVVRDRSKG